MKIRFFSDAYKIKRASHRLRGDVTCAALAAQGYDAKILTDWGEVDADTLIIFLKGTKVHTIEQARALGAQTVYDLCDNKFDSTPDPAVCANGWKWSCIEEGFDALGRASRLRQRRPRWLRESRTKSISFYRGRY